MTVSELAALVGGRVVSGDESLAVRGVASLTGAESGDLAFVENAKLAESAARASRASCLLVPPGATFSPDANRCVIEVERPKLAFALIAAKLHSPPNRGATIHPTAIVHESATVDATAFVGPHAHVGENSRIGARAQIHAGAFVGDAVEIGADCVLHPRVVIYDRARLGERVTLHAGAVIGADGFGYVRAADGYHKFPQIGTVFIDDDVEIGAQTCVDRGALGETRIGRGTKIDNLVQIAHNVRIGERVVIAAQTGISGSTVIEDDAVIGGQVGMGDHARVERGAVIGSGAGVLPGKIVRRGAVMWGVPVRPLDEYKRLNALWGRLPRMRADLDELKKKVNELFDRE